jgi:phosphomannomutase
VYWENAAQIVPPVDARIAAAIDKAPAARDVPRPSLAELRARDRLRGVPAEIERAYTEAVLSLSVHPAEGDRTLRIVYTALHGVGDALVRRVLERAGFTDVASVPAQQKPDGAFPTVAFPNPEEPGAMDLAFALARERGADLVLANDPDVDRLAAAIPDGGEFRQLTGNDLGVLLGHYLLTERERRGGSRAVLASIVSSPLLGRIARDLGVRYEETLTGFKWIASRSIELEREGCEFVFGYEEALGYCVGSVVHDKDGISAALLTAELAAVLRARGQTLKGALEGIERRWGVFTSSQISATRKGADGRAAIRAMMQALRGSPPERLADDEVLALSDYEAGTCIDLRPRAVARLALPKSDVISLDLASGSRVIARPSGTEPKAKFYFDVREEVLPGEPVARAEARAAARMKRIADAFVVIAGL